MTRILALLLVLLAVRPAPAAGPSTAPAPPADAAAGTFADHVDLGPLGRIAVYADGRVRSFDSFARSTMRLVSGARQVDGRSPVFTYLDMMLRPGEYLDVPVIYIKKKHLRAQIAQALQRGGRAADDPAVASFIQTGLIPETLIREPEVIAVVEGWSRDLVRTAKFANQVRTAVGVKDPGFLVDGWRVLPPADGSTDIQWFNLRQVMGATDPVAELGGLSPEAHQRLIAAWRGLFEAWTADEAAAGGPAAKGESVNAAVVALAGQLAAVQPDLYPSSGRLGWESWYFRSYNLTWIWVLYALSLVPLLLHFVFRWSAARWTGLGLFLVAFGFHTFALGLRWYVSGRWPNSNMFEAVTTSVWFGGCAALILEAMVRRSPMRSLFALGAAVSSMVALMCAWFMPLSLDAGIENRMPVLRDVWLYIHTNVIIFSYCLIFMAAVSAALYLVYRGLGRMGGFSGPRDFARAGGGGLLLAGAGTGPGGSGGTLAAARGMIGQVLDGTTMVLMELSFVMLWAGIVMGAIWADHSWGRPWGWDPKEVFALNTFLVFAILIHVRINARDKGLWTALLALVGAGVMLFNWIAINFVITGLHSYA